MRAKPARSAPNAPHLYQTAPRSEKSRIPPMPKARIAPRAVNQNLAPRPSSFMSLLYWLTAWSCGDASSASSERDERPGPPERAWRNAGLTPQGAARPESGVLGRAHIYGYGRSLRPCLGTTIAP